MSAVGSLGSEEVLGLLFIFIWVAEVDLDEWAASSWVVEDGSDDTSNVALSLSEIEVAISGRSDSFRLRSSVDTSFFTFSLAYRKPRSYIG